MIRLDNGGGGGTTTSYFVENGYTLELWYKSQLVHSWTADIATIPSGTPVGLLLAILTP